MSPSHSIHSRLRRDTTSCLGADYSGTSSPPSGSYTGSVSWSTDGSVVNTGWKMCRQDSSPSPEPTPAPSTPAPTPPGSWELTGSGCRMDGDCISSLNHPADYGINEECNVQLSGDIQLRFDAFNTESRYDVLSVGGRSYSGTSGPADGSYSGSISWTSDYSVTRSGWKFCRA